MKKFVVIVWILIATNWYNPVNTSQVRFSIVLSPVSSDPPPFAKRDNCFQLEVLQHNGFYIKAAADPGYFNMN